MSTVVVTGANRGLGLEFCRQLLARGDRVFAACRKPGRATELNRLAFDHPGRLHVQPLDLARPESIAAFAAELALSTDRLDLLVNNAGVLPEGERYGALEARCLHESFATNAAGPLLLTQALTPALENGAPSRVLNLSSDLGSLAQTTRFGTPSYAMGKAALNMATRQMAFELAGRGIVCVAVNPGWVRTDMGGARAPLEAAESVASLLALAGRLGPAQAGGLFERDGSVLAW